MYKSGFQVETTGRLPFPMQYRSTYRHPTSLTFP